MRKRRSQSKEEGERREKALKAVHERMERWKRMEAGDVDALWECMYDAEMCTKEELDAYRKDKEKDNG